jgi:hypothetical protein
MRNDWQINPDWPSDTTGIEVFGQRAEVVTGTMVLIVVDGWRFFLAGSFEPIEIIDFRDSKSLVVVDGSVYLVDPAKKTVSAPGDIDFVDQLVYSADHDLVFLCAFSCRLYAIGPEGVRWVVDDLHTDEMRIIEVQESEVIAEAYDPQSRETLRFRVSIDSGEHDAPTFMRE